MIPFKVLILKHFKHNKESVVVSVINMFYIENVIIWQVIFPINVERATHILKHCVKNCTSEGTGN